MGLERPFTENYTVLFNTYFYKIKISIFKKLNFGPKWPKMTKIAKKLQKSAKKCAQKK